MMELPLWVLLAPAAVFLLLCFRFARRPKGFRFAAAGPLRRSGSGIVLEYALAGGLPAPDLGLAGSSTDCRVAVLRN